MPRAWKLALLSAVIVSAPSMAQSPVRFKWEAGQTLTYRAEQVTSVSDITEKQKIETSTKMILTKRWQVLSVDEAGVATLQMSLLALRMETRKPDRETIVFDSSDTDPANAKLNKDLLQYVGPPLATLKLDSLGRLVEVKESKFGSASRYTSDLPFKITLPDKTVTAGESWERTYQIKLEPPQGAGETYDAVQKYTCKSATVTLLIIGMTTTIKNLPEAPADQIPLIPMQAEGRVVFSLADGRMQKAELTIAHELTDHRGEGSKYTFRSTYVEELIEK
ncbi:MAG TPA: hypothetical protein VGZ47_22525 [Gemmataceae bacterium]|jgi:hypothetical protein|nr:hypothetical protein [Gemmataceae bacterium]